MFSGKWISFSKYMEILEAELEALSFKPDRVTKMFEYMGIGMLVIFIIIGVIILATLLINKIFSEKKNGN